MIMYNQTNDIMQAIYMYTEQIEQYENLSTWFAAFTAGSILVLLIIAALLVIGRKKQNEQALFNGILSGVFAIMPVLVTLYLYTFAMNMRKVALYRGYLSYLERRWNELSGVEFMQFNDKMIGEFFSVQSFPVNGLGPVVMAFFVMLAIILGFGMSIYFLCHMPVSRISKMAKMLVYIIMVVCVSFNGLCVYYLSINDSVVTNVIAFCERVME